MTGREQIKKEYYQVLHFLSADEKEQTIDMILEGKERGYIFAKTYFELLEENNITIRDHINRLDKYSELAKKYNELLSLYNNELDTVAFLETENDELGRDLDLMQITLEAQKARIKLLKNRIKKDGK